MKLGQATDIFLDRDGVVIKDKHYLKNPDLVELTPGAGPALKSLVRAGKRLFLVTNQSGLGRGYMDLADFQACQDRLKLILARHGVSLTGQAYCPHAPDQGCACRKPMTGMWSELRDRFKLDPKKCLMIGDKIADVAFGLNCGFMASIMVLTGHGRDHSKQLGLPALHGDRVELVERRPDWPHFMTTNLASACSLILARD